MPIFQDHFLDNDNDWEIRDDAHARLELPDGDYAYTFEQRQPDGEWTTWQPLFFEDGASANEGYKIHAVIEHVKGELGGYGLLWQCATEQNCYSFEINRDGAYAIRRCQAGKWSFVQPWQPSELIKQGAHALNELLIVQLKHRAKFFINEKQVAELKLQRPTEGHGFGFIVHDLQTIRIHSSIVLRHVEPPHAPLPAAYDDDEVQSVLDELHALVGMENIKQEVQTFINFLRVQQMRKERGLAATPLTYHMVLLGPPGTGKTTVARLLGKLYKALGILPSGHLIETDRAGIVAPYIGQTALKVEKKVDEALGGVLFIDEAYALMPKEGASGQDFGQEAIEALLKRMEDLRGQFALVIAGYADEMNRFLDANPGVRSRFNRYLQFEHYKPNELVAIFELLATHYQLQLTPEARRKLKKHLAVVYAQRSSAFGNGRYVRSLLEKTIERQANRLVTLSHVSDKDLCTLVVDDVMDSAEITLF